MADNYLSGKTGYTTVGASNMSFAKWKAPLRTKTVNISNFNTAPYEAYIAALSGTKVTLEGPYNQGNMGMTSGSTYNLVLGFTTNVSLSVTGILEELTPDNDAEGAPRINATFQSTGSFTLSIT